MLFTYGDQSQWLVTTPSAVYGEYYDNKDRDIIKSSFSDVPYTAKWYNREEN